MSRRFKKSKSFKKSKHKTKSRTSRNRTSKNKTGSKKSRNIKSLQKSKRSQTLYKLYKSTLPGKKFDVYVRNKKTGGTKKVSFGATGYEDYTIHHDKDRRERYRSRHKNDKINNPLYPGFWSWHILWGDSTSISQNMKNINKYL